MQNGKSYLVVGLGNPGKKYSQTLHNIGFKVVEEFACKHRFEWKEEKKFSSFLAEGVLQGKFENTHYVLLKPMTFMNLSGRAVWQYLEYYNLPIDQIVVIVDDADLPLGKLIVRLFGGTAGHRGVNSIRDCLNTTQFKRVRIGIGRGDNPDMTLADYVLDPQGKEIWDRLHLPIEKAVQFLEKLVDENFETVMHTVNGETK